MKLHADYSLPAVVESGGLPWTTSPIAGVERRMLERDGDEVLLFDAPWERVVMRRIEPGYTGRTEALPRGGEHFVVGGDVIICAKSHAAGTWLRFPAGSQITWASAGGALLYCTTGHLG